MMAKPLLGLWSWESSLCLRVGGRADLGRPYTGPRVLTYSLLSELEWIKAEIY